MPPLKMNSQFKFTKYTMKKLHTAGESTKPIKKEYLDFLELLIEPDRTGTWVYIKVLKPQKIIKKMIGKE